MDAQGQVTAPIFETTSFEWDTILPFRLQNPWTSSPVFDVLDTQVCYFVSIDRAQTYTVQLCCDRDQLKNISFRYSFQMYLRRRRLPNIYMFSSRGYHAENILIHFISFHRTELEPFAFNTRVVPVTVKFTISEYEKRCSIVNQYIQTSSYLNASSHKGSLSDSLKKVLKEYHEDSDVVVKCADETIMGHTLLFNARSIVFKKIINNDKLLTIQPMDTEQFNEFIYYLYTDELPKLNYMKALSFYELSDMYDLKGLMSRCREYLMDNLNETVACKCMGIADSHSDKELIEYVVKYILDNELFLCNKIWAPFCEDFPVLALSIVNKSHHSNKKRKLE